MEGSGKQYNNSRMNMLPEEIVDLIASYVGDTIKDLRWTCKSIHQKTDHAFLQRYMTARTVWANRRSLQNLEDIAGEGRFASQVRKLIIMPYEWDLDAAENFWGDDDDLEGKDAQEYQQFLAEYSDQRFILQSGSMMTCLAQTMKKFNKLETMVMFPEPTDKIFRPHGRLIWQDLPGLNETISEDFVNASWFILCHAIISSGIQLKAINAGMDQENQLPPGSIIPLVSRRLDAIAPVFRNLDMLELGFQVPWKKIEGQMWNSAFGKFLSLCTQVSTLTLGFAENDETPYEHDEEPQIWDISNWPKFPNLRCLNMLWFHLPSGQLLSFLKKHTATLKELTLFEFELLEQDHWVMLLEDIAAHFDLDEARIIMFEIRHRDIKLIDAKRPNIRQAIEDRTRDGIFCRKCARKEGIAVETSDSEESDTGFMYSTDGEDEADDDEDEDAEYPGGLEPGYEEEEMMIEMDVADDEEGLWVDED